MTTDSVDPTAPPATTSAHRHRVRFRSRDDECVAWHYPGTNGACVVMAGGMGLTKEVGTDRFAARFQDAGFSVLAFDYRRIGESGGTPRDVVRLRDQRVDWAAAVAYAATLPGADPARIAIWGFSVSGGLVLEVATETPGVAVAIAQAPNVDGRAATRNAMRYTTKRALARVMGRAIADAIGGRLGAAPRTVALSGPPGSVAVLSTPDAQDGERALDPDGRYADWSRSVAARSILPLGRYRPARVASRIGCPLLVVAFTDDQSALAAPAVAVAERAPDAELVRLPGSHYAAFLDQHDATVVAEIDFMTRRLLAPAEATDA